MPIITSLQAQQHDTERVSIYLDGSFGFAASLMLVMARNLREGQKLTDHEIVTLQRDDAVDRAYAAALNYVSIRPRSSREIRDYFWRKRTESGIVEAVVQRLERSGILNDREFAEYWLDNRQTFRPRGKRALQAELRQKGVASDVIDEALEAISDEDKLAYEAAQQKMRSLEKLDEREFFRKMVQFLQRRGFSYPTAETATKRIQQEGPQ